MLGFNWVDTSQTNSKMNFSLVFIARGKIAQCFSVPVGRLYRPACATDFMSFVSHYNGRIKNVGWCFLCILNL